MDAKENSEEWYRGTLTYENAPARLNNLNIDLFGISEFFSEGDFDRIYLFGVGGNRLRTLPCGSTTVKTEQRPTATRWRATTFRKSRFRTRMAN